MKQMFCLIMITLAVSFTVFGGGQTEEKVEAEGPVTLRLMFQGGRQSESAQAIADIYQKENPRISIEIDPIPYTVSKEKTLLTLSSGEYAWDAIATERLRTYTFVKNGWLLPLDKWLGSYLDDFIPAYIENAGKFEGLAPAKTAGSIYGIPFTAGPLVWVYRTDLYQKFGLTPAVTWADFISNSKKLNDPENNFYAYGWPGFKGPQLSVRTLSHLYSWGKPDVLDSDLKPMFDTEDNERALNELVKVVNEYKFTPPSVFEDNFAELNTLFAQSKIAQMIQWPHASAPVIEPPDKSEVSGKIGYTNLPGEKGIALTYLDCWTSAVTYTAKNPEEAWNWIKFFSSKEMSRVGIDPWGTHVVRKSLAADPELTAKYQYIKPMMDQAAHYKHLPPLPEVWPIHNVVAEQAQMALKQDITPKQALQAMDKQVEELLKEAGYY